jgi:hypothetical protein
VLSIEILPPHAYRVKQESTIYPRVLEWYAGTVSLKSYVHQAPSLCLTFANIDQVHDRLCGLVVRVLDRCRGPGFDSRELQKKVVGLEQGPLSLVSTTEELLDRKVADPV